MHILYIHQYFATPRGHTGTRSYEFARRWVADGHRVTMLTSTAQLTAEDLGSCNARWVRRLTIDGINVLAINVAYHQQMGIARRLFSFLTFMIAASWYALTIRDVDVVYVSSTPLTVGVPALLAKWFRGRRFVFEVRDPWPAVPIALGVIRNKAVIWLARLLEKTLYRNAEAVITLSPGMETIVRGAFAGVRRLCTVTNCADTDFFRPDIDGTSVREKWNWRDRVVCVHTGAMGRVNGLDVIVRAALHFKDRTDLLFVFVGEGRERKRLESDCQRLQLSNVQFVGSVPKQMMPTVLAAADICLMTVSNVSVLEHNSANKLFDYLSAGRPVVLNYGGWQRDVLEGAGAGRGCEMGNDMEFFSAIASLSSDRERRESMGKSARHLAMAEFDRDRSSVKVLDVLQAATSI